MGRKGTKQVAVWRYKDRDIEFDVPVKMVQADRECRTADDEKVYFRVQLDEPEVDERGTDINELQSRVFAKIKEGLNIEWKSMIVVEVSGNRHRLFDKRKRSDTPDTESQVSNDLALSWKRVQIAEIGKKKVRRGFQSYVKAHKGIGHSYPAHEQWGGAVDGWPEVGTTKTEAWRRSLPEIIAMIPDTPANREALEEIADGMKRIYDGLGRLLCADAIEETLARVATNKVQLLSVDRAPEAGALA